MGKVPLLKGSFIAGCTLAFFAWVMPSFVSHGMFATTAFFISTMFGFIGAMSAWHRDSTLEQELEQTPEPAEAVLADCKKNRRPYAVYLRSFNHERLQNPFPIPFGRIGGSARRVELQLVKVLRGRLPILALSDPAYPFSMPGSHRFGPLTIPWPMFLERLLQDSSLIIFYIAESNPGLTFEINLVRELGLMGKVLVIVHSFRFKDFQDSKWVTNETAPHLESTLDEILESFDTTPLETVADEAASATSSHGGSRVPREYERQRLNQPDTVGAHSPLKMAAQVFVFLLPLIMAFEVWGVPDVLLRDYWSYDKPMSEIRKTQDDIRKINEKLKRAQPYHLQNKTLPTTPDDGLRPTPLRQRSHEH